MIRGSSSGYCALTGCFLTRDLAKDGRNWYAYCENNPIKRLDPEGLSVRGWLDDRRVELSEWWSGTDVIGPNGEPVRIGGWHASFFNRDENDMTVDRTVHLNDYDDYEGYINDKPWADHELRHIHQAEEWFGGSGIAFVTYAILGYILAGGHDGAPLEIDAQDYADGTESDIYSGGLWPIFGRAKEYSIDGV